MDEHRIAGRKKTITLCLNARKGDVMKIEEERRGWHVGKEIPLAMLFAVLVQSGAAIWWAATLSAKLDDLSYQVAALSAEKYTKTDAEKDQRYFIQRLEDSERRISLIEGRK